jgi:hypothetical protein
MNRDASMLGGVRGWLCACGLRWLEIPRRCPGCGLGRLHARARNHSVPAEPEACGTVAN